MTPSRSLLETRPGKDLTVRVGNTPRVPIGGLDVIPGAVTVLGKAERLDPGGSERCLSEPLWSEDA